MGRVDLARNTVSPRCECGRRVSFPEILKVTPILKDGVQSFPDATVCRVCLKEQGYQILD